MSTKTTKTTIGKEAKPRHGRPDTREGRGVSTRLTVRELMDARRHLEEYDAATARGDRVERLRLSRRVAADCRALLAEAERARKDTEG